jgi:hypothetical protein
VKPVNDHPADGEMTPQQLCHTPHITAGNPFPYCAAAESGFPIAYLVEHVHAEAQFPAQAAQQVHIPFAVPAEGVIIPDNEPLHGDIARQDLADEPLGGNGGELVGKGESDKVIDPRFPDEPLLFRVGGDQPEIAPSSAAADRTLRKISRCPRCTPSKLPTVTTALEILP